MRKRNLRLVLALLCIPVLAVTPALAGGSGAAAPGSVGGSGNESATNWFVELASAPAVKGTSKAKLKAERDAFKANAAAEGVKVSERFAYDSLWNGMSVSVAPSKIAALRSISGVKAIYPVHTVSLPDLRSEGGGGANLDMKNAVGLTGADIAQNELGIDGSGVTIAIMDSGLDWTLPEFGDCFGGSNCKVRGGLDLVGDTYNATPTSPAFQPVPHPDGNPLPCDPNDADRAEVLGAGTSNAGHGTHVAGIAAADGRGHTGQIVGAAPGARLLAYRVFGCNGSTDTDVMIHAMELALGRSRRRAEHEHRVGLRQLAAVAGGRRRRQPRRRRHGRRGLDRQQWRERRPAVVGRLSGRRPQGDRRRVLRQHEGDAAGVPGRLADVHVQPCRRLARDRSAVRWR